MIIFNVAAIIVLLIAALLCIPFFIIYAFGGMNESILVIFMSWMILVASFIGKNNDINGRLFFIPMWILSIPLPFVFTYIKYEWLGIGVTFGIFFGFILFVVLLAYFQESKRLRKLRSEKILFPEIEVDSLAYWKAVKDKFFIPSFIKMTPEIGRFNIRVAKALEKDDATLTTLESFVQEMNKVGSRHQKINPAVAKELMAEIDLKISALKQQLEIVKNSQI
ncbi:hypothetical protein C8N46_105177 [Kordia periserrulae]|uniref:Uncharacterized protein n=1 Tax=Kordia periserrulae TaxID=701523 RepID=A0A2T6BY59_9FLAO|nr:hypothetical protein [Kordia periserrulae]PTX61021.1 hypothetical protein C8N46_105177 [Kordia periserrulae]